jgi:hypothetical protein
MKPYFLIEADISGDYDSFLTCVSCEEHLPSEVKRLIHGGWDRLQIIMDHTQIASDDLECFDCYVETK